MNHCRRGVKLIALVCFIFLVTGCMKLEHDQHHDYETPSPIMRNAMVGAAAGGTIGMIASPVHAPIGFAAGAFIGGATGVIGSARQPMISRLRLMGVQVERYGDQLTLILPSDKIFELNTETLTPVGMDRLIEVTHFLSDYGEGDITISAFTDNVGDDDFKLQLSFKQAQSVLAYLWSHGIDYKRMRAVGYGNMHDVASNETILGNAFNRRIELHTQMRASYIYG